MTYFFWDNFGVQFIPFELGKLKKIICKWGNFGPSDIGKEHWRQILKNLLCNFFFLKNHLK